MTLLKAARIRTGRPKEDNFADGWGIWLVPGRLLARKMDGLIGEVEK
jgi:hypothetical protein